MIILGNVLFYPFHSLSYCLMTLCMLVRRHADVRTTTPHDVKRASMQGYEYFMNENRVATTPAHVENLDLLCWFSLFHAHSTYENVLCLWMKLISSFWRNYTSEGPLHRIRQSGFWNAICKHACTYVLDVCVWMDLHFACAWTDKFNLYSVFKNLTTIGRCPMNMNILPTNYGSHRQTPKNKNRKVSKDFDWITEI